MFDSADNYYISDDDEIRRVDGATGVITTVVEDLFAPRHIALLDDDTLLLVHNGGNEISSIDVATGAMTTIAGDGFMPINRIYWSAPVRVRPWSWVSVTERCS